MTSAATESSADLSPSGRHSLASLFERRGATWREGLDGSAALLGGLAGAVVATVLVRFARHRRGAS